MTTSSDVANLERFLGKGIPSNDGINYNFKCPICKNTENKKKLVIRIADGWYHCWVCEAKGHNVISFIAKNVAASVNSIEFSFSKKENRIFSKDTKDEEVVHEKAKLPEKTVLLLDAPDSNRNVRDVRQYVFDRGLDEASIRRHRLCYSQNSGYYRRIIFPSFGKEGQINYCVARAIDEDAFPKYKNSKVPKIDIIFNEIDINWQKPLIIVEGPFDVTKCPNNATCLLGSSLSEKSLLFKMIVMHNTPIILALDPDAESKCHKVAQLLYSAGIDVKKATVIGEDIGALSTEDAKRTLKEAKSWSPYDSLSYKISNLRSGSIL